MMGLIAPFVLAHLQQFDRAIHDPVIGEGDRRHVEFDSAINQFW